MGTASLYKQKVDVKPSGTVSHMTIMMQKVDSHLKKGTGIPLKESSTKAVAIC
jgi:hypothetical protein